MEISSEQKAYYEKLGEAIENAAKNLPDGYTINIALQRNSGVAELCDDEGDDREFPSNHESLADTINDAVEFAMFAEVLVHCPFCGSKPTLNGFDISCDTVDCYAYGGTCVDYDSQADAIKAWNRRIY